MISSETLRPSANPGRKQLGKLATRLEELKSPWRQVSTLELSHNEAARLAMDALLESGEKGYRQVLTEEREVNFLSSVEVKYIIDSSDKNSVSDVAYGNGLDGDIEGDTVSELTSGTYFPMMSDEDPPVLELGWPDLPSRYGPSDTEIYFQRDKTHNIKDLVRSLINKAKKVIALVMDIFTDVDLFCDLMEASNKRRVPVYILLDEKNMHYFIEMCKALNVDNSHCQNMRIRSVSGDTYCTKSGKKFTGQVQEKFVIIDCEEVLAGSYSFTWLSGQVHSNMVLHFSGRVAETFDREFRCLYADSQIIGFFHNSEEEDDVPYYRFSRMGPSFGLDTVQDRTQEKAHSDNSSSHSNNSCSSIKKAPGMAATVYKIDHEKKDSNSNFSRSEWRANQNQGILKGRGSQGSPGQSLVVDHPIVDQNTGALGQGARPERYKAGNSDAARYNVAGATWLQDAGLYTKQNYNHSSSKSPPAADSKPLRTKSPSNPFLNKITDLFSVSGKERDSYTFKKSPPQSSTAFGGPDLTMAEPESKQPLPPPVPLPSDGVLMERRLNRHDEKRLTLGHSKLDLVNHYNKMKTKHIYSRFELKDN